jgi:Xaa-Pro aminopeptidase
MTTHLVLLWIIALCMLPAHAGAQSDVAFPPDVYAARRQQLLDRIGRHPLILPGAEMTSRGVFDKQDPNFWYLTGVESPFAVMVVVPTNGGVREILFLPDSFQFAGAQNPHDDPRFRFAAWNRTIKRLVPGTETDTRLGIDESLPLRTLAQRVPELVGQSDTVFILRRGDGGYVPPGFPARVEQSRRFEDTLVELTGASHVGDATPHVERMRLTKDEHEIDALRRAAAISVIGLREAMRMIEPGVNDREVAGWMEYIWKREGSPQPSFGPIVSSGAGSVSLYSLKSENYNATDRVMNDGELVFIDYGAAEYRTYTSDICRTFPVNGRFTPLQRRYYEIVLEAQDSALAAIRRHTGCSSRVSAAWTGAIRGYRSDGR